MNVYEREFYADIKSKRITGRGSFNKRGKGVKHGMSGALKTPSYYMKPKEKKLLNGKCEVMNMNEIMTLEQLKTFSKEKQKEIVENWRANFKGTEIIEKMGITNKMKYYDLLNELGVKKANMGNVKLNQKKFSQKEIEGFKETMVDYVFYRSLPLPLKAEIFTMYDERYSTDELMANWGVSSSTIYQVRAAVKNHLSKQKGKEKKEKSVAISAPVVKEQEPIVPLIGKSINEFVEEISESAPEQAELDLKEPEIGPETTEEPVVEVSVAPPVEAEKGMKFNFMDEGNAQDLEHQLKTIAEIFRNKSKLYKFEINITEIGEDEVIVQEEVKPEEVVSPEKVKVDSTMDILNLLKTLGQVL